MDECMEVAKQDLQHQIPIVLFWCYVQSPTGASISGIHEEKKDHGGQTSFVP